MKYTVVWQPTALNRLAEIWLAAADRELVAKAADELENLVAENDVARNASGVDRRRALAVSPLGIEYW